MHNDFDAVGEEEAVVTCFCRNLDLEENLLLRKDKLHNYRYIHLIIDKDDNAHSILFSRFPYLDK